MEIVRGHACANCAEASLAGSGVDPSAPRAEVKEAAQTHADNLVSQRNDAVIFSGRLADVQTTQAAAPAEPPAATRAYTPGAHVDVRV